MKFSPMVLRDLGRGPVYRLYAHRLRRQVAGGPLPRHVGLVMDGNRRWARQQGLASPSLGHRYGAQHAEDVLGWCERIGISHVTVFMCSTENLTRRDPAEVAFLMRVIEQFVAGRLSRLPSWQVHVAGDLDVLPDDTARALKQAAEASRDRTSGEQRLSNFLLWQSAYSELYFCEAYWPAFREIDFLRALRSFAARHRRYGH